MQADAAELRAVLSRGRVEPLLAADFFRPTPHSFDNAGKRLEKKPTTRLKKLPPIDGGGSR
jgi:hypothetical protein